MHFYLVREWTQLNEYHRTKANKELVEQGKTMKMMLFILPNWILKPYVWLLSRKMILQHTYLEDFISLYIKLQGSFSTANNPSRDFGILSEIVWSTEHLTLIRNYIQTALVIFYYLFSLLSSILCYPYLVI